MQNPPQVRRMRASRTYGSGRGACDETHVPTATGLFFAAPAQVWNWQILLQKSQIARR
jgi:hypothetical protein